jgi:hypothetical protein
MTRAIVRVVGIVLAVGAFFLPAVRNPGSGPGSGIFVGWACAVSALMATAGLLHLGAALQGKDAVGAISLMFSGWVNPLVLLYLVFCIRSSWARVRHVLAAAILLCLLATWVFLFKAPMTPLVGHFLWVAGIVTILGAEFVKG